MSRCLQLLLVFFSLVACQSGPKLDPAAVVPKAIAPVGLAILQGVSGSTWVRISVLREDAKTYTYAYQSQESKTPMAVVPATTHKFPGSAWVVDEVEIKGLAVGPIYDFLVVGAGGDPVDRREFKTLPSKDQYQFAVVSCSDDFYAQEQKPMWDDLVSKRPDFILAVGDNVYADRKDGKALGDVGPEVLWSRYVETRNTLAVFRSPILVPMVAIWDDHDFGANDGDRRYPHRAEALKVFHAFFPQGTSAENFVKGPGAASRWSPGSQAFLLLDGRSFRSPNAVSPACKKKPEASACKPRIFDRGPDPLSKKEPETHFGSEQERWAFSEVRKIRRPTWLVTGSQWFGAYQPFESYEGNHPNSFRKFVREMSKSAFRAAFISGDRHSSEFMRLPKKVMGYESFEITSSPIHAKVFPSNWIDFPNPLQAFGTAEAINYTLVSSQIEKASWKVKVTNLKPAGVEAFVAEGLIWLNK